MRYHDVSAGEAEKAKPEAEDGASYMSGWDLPPSGSDSEDLDDAASGTSGDGLDRSAQQAGKSDTPSASSPELSGASSTSPEHHQTTVTAGASTAEAKCDNDGVGAAGQLPDSGSSECESAPADRTMDSREHQYSGSRGGPSSSSQPSASTGDHQDDAMSNHVQPSPPGAHAHEAAEDAPMDACISDPGDLGGSAGNGASRGGQAKSAAAPQRDGGSSHVIEDVADAESSHKGSGRPTKAAPQEEELVDVFRVHLGM